MIESSLTRETGRQKLRNRWIGISDREPDDGSPEHRLRRCHRNARRQRPWHRFEVTIQQNRLVALKVGIALLIAMSVTVLVLGSRAALAEEVEPLHVKAFDISRYSDLLRPETRVGLDRWNALTARAREICSPFTKETGKEIRDCEKLMYAPLLAEARKLYSVNIASKTIGGVTVDVLTPAEGVSRRNARRVLIYIHGGGFKYGGGGGGLIESMPVAAFGKYKVVAVDYRMAPEHTFPAASIDIAAVYKALLKEYPPSQIGIYGCSAGGRIAGQAVAWIASRNLPTPGALGIMCSPPASIAGDSNVIVAALLDNSPLVRDFTAGYFAGVSPSDPMAFPADFDDWLRRFPPTLAMTSTRDYSLSPMVVMHARLIRLDVPAELHIFEGLRHAEYSSNIYIPETREAATIVARFFDKYLTISAEMPGDAPK